MSFSRLGILPPSHFIKVNSQMPICSASSRIQEFRNLSQWASNKRGPTFYRFGRNVRYKLSDIESWVTRKEARPSGEEW
jgi:hypothetical protein